MSVIAIRPMTADDWPNVRTIFEQGIASGNATFETEAPDWPAWNTAHLAGGRLVASKRDVVIGWVALTPVSSRCVYAGVAEVSVYIGETARGQGVGTALLHELVRVSEQMGLWTLQAGILRENVASLALHTACGFRVVGYRERIGKRNGVWRDVMLLERRSAVVG